MLRDTELGEKDFVIEMVVEIPSEDRYICSVNHLVSCLLEETGFDDEDKMQICLAVVEAGTNAMKHGNKSDPEKVVQFQLTIVEDRLTVYVRDCGTGFDLENIDDPLFPGNLLKPCGRGIFLMRTFMDEVEYNMDENRGTEVRMVKYRNAPERQDIQEQPGNVLGSGSLADALTNIAGARGS